MEVLIYAQLQELDPTKNPSDRNYVLGSIDTDGLFFSGTYALPAIQSLSDDGSLRIVAIPYLQGVSVIPGTNAPTFKSELLESYLLEVLMYLQITEKQTAKNPLNRNYITGSFNSDTDVYQGSFNLPVDISISPAGSIVVDAQEYLINA